MAPEELREPAAEMPDEARTMHRPIISLIEGLEPVDGYQQRAEVCRKEELKAIPAHNRGRGKRARGHAAEWDPRERSGIFHYLSTARPIAHEQLS
jgi:hypothetical protein